MKNPRPLVTSRSLTGSAVAAKRRLIIASLCAGAAVGSATAQPTLKAYRPSYPYRAQYSLGSDYASYKDRYTHHTLVLGGAPDARLVEENGKSSLGWTYGTQIPWAAGPEYWHGQVTNRTRPANSTYPYNFVAAGNALDEWLYRSDPTVYQNLYDGLVSGRNAAPERFVAIWYVDTTSTQLRDLAKNGGADLLVAEGYTHIVSGGGIPFQQGISRMEDHAIQGIERKIVFGIGEMGEQRNWWGGKFDEISLRIMMETVRQKYPGTPGMAIYGNGQNNSDWDKLAKLVDRLLYEYWPALPIRNGLYGVTPQLATNRRMDAANSSTANGTSVVSYTAGFGYTTKHNQRWKFTHLGDNVYKIQPSYSNAVALDVKSASSADGAVVQLYADNGTDAQKWKLTPAPGNGIGYMLSPLCAPYKFLRVTSASNDAAMEIRADQGDDSQLWALTPEVSSLERQVTPYQAPSFVGTAGNDGAWVGSAGGTFKTGSAGRVVFSGVTGGSGQETLVIRYMLVSGSRTCKLVVNGVTTNITFPKTEHKYNYEKLRLLVDLNSGSSNTVEIVSDSTTDASPALDYIAVSDASLVSDDWEVPSMPRNFHRTGNWGTSVEMAWDAATDNVGVTQYQIYRDGMLVGSTTSTSYQDFGLSSGYNHTYYVKALDAAGNMSPISVKDNTNSGIAVVTLLDEVNTVIAPAGYGELGVEVAGSGTANGSNVQVRTYSAASNQKWRVYPQGGGIYEIEPQNAPGQRLDVTSAHTAPGTNVQIYADNNTNAQRWKAIDAGGGYVELEPQNAPGKRLQISGTIGSGSNMTIQTVNGADSQRFQMKQVP